MDLELFMPSQDTVLVEALMPSRKLQDASPGSSLSVEQLSRDPMCTNPPLHNASRSHPYLSGLPNVELFAGPRGTCVSLHSRSVLHRFSFLLSCVMRSSRCRIARWLSCARDQGLPVALTIVRLHVWDGSGRKYTFVSSRLGEGMPSVLVLGDSGVGAKLLGTS